MHTIQVKYTNLMRLAAERSGEGCGKVCFRSGRALPSLDRIKREKGVWWMPWQQEAMKDVILCDKRRRAENRL